MQSQHFTKAAVLTLLLVIGSVAGWELYLRSKGVGIAYDDGKELWADKRARVYQQQDKATVFIGSSRIKYDLDIPTWRAITGEDAVQLACEGASPLPVLDDLAADEKFKGKLIIDVTEGLFFGDVGGGPNNVPGFVAFAKKQTPAERASFALNRPLESTFVFLDKDNFSINAMLDRLELKNRPGVFGPPIFPMEFGRIDFNRQNRMTDRFLADTTLQRRVTDIWTMLRNMNPRPPATGAKLDSFFAVVKSNVEKIKSRGGQVLFVRTPSSGPFWMGEQMGFSRDKYWEPLIRHAASPGIHFSDYPVMAKMVCPEWSHLSPADAVVFTKAFVTALEEKGWRFKSRQSLVSHQNSRP